MGAEDIFDPNPRSTDAPRAGFYEWTRRGRPPQPVAIFYGFPIDYELEGTIDVTKARRLDRSPRWQMLVSGRPVAFEEDDKLSPWDPLWSDVWPHCSGSPISCSEYVYLVARIDHAQSWGDRDPFAAPHRRIDLNEAAMPQ
jgi:hypothetical protein